MNLFALSRHLQSSLPRRSQPIKVQNTLQQYLRTQLTILSTRILRRIMTDPLSTRHENHGRRTMLARVHAIMASTRLDIPDQVLDTTQHLDRRLPHRLDAVLVEARHRRLAVRLPRHLKRLAPPRSPARMQPSNILTRRQSSEVSLQLFFECRDDRVLRRADVETEADVAGDGVCGARRERQDAGGGECRVSSGAAV